MQLQPQLTDISTDQEDRGVEMFVTIDHDAAARHGISSRDIDNALYNAFGQRTASTIYEEMNQYSVIIGVAPRYEQSRDALTDVYVPRSEENTYEIQSLMRIPYHV